MSDLKFQRTPDKISDQFIEQKDKDVELLSRMTQGKEVSSALIAQLCEHITKGLPIDVASKNINVPLKKIREWLKRGQKEEEQFFSLMEKGEHETFDPSPFYYLYIAVTRARGENQKFLMEKLYEKVDNGDYRALELALKKQGGEFYEEKEKNATPSNNQTIEKAVIINTPIKSDSINSEDWAKKVMADNKSRSNSAFSNMENEEDESE